MLPKILEGEKAKFSVKDGYGNKCPFIFANTPLAKRLSSLTQIMDDLLHAKELIQLVSTVEEGEIQYSLWMSAVVTYGKCFATAKGRKIKLEEKHIKDTCPDALSFHKDQLIVHYLDLHVLFLFLFLNNHTLMYDNVDNKYALFLQYLIHFLRIL